MIYVDNQNITNPEINLAIEEYILRHLDQEQTYLLFYINDPSIIIGKNQNTVEEINTNYVEENDIYVVRRLSGGGAVYHDRGNLNFSFITKDEGEFRDFHKFTEPVIQMLRSLGVDAELVGRNDIEVNGRKISGNAQYSARGRMFSHGTLLFDSNIDDVVSALRVKQDKIQSKGIQSIRKRVANISEFLDQPMSILQFKQKILESIFGGKDKIKEYRLTDTDWEKIYDISRNRYQRWEWNYGRSPKFNVQLEHRFPVGKVDIRLDVASGVIQSAKIYGDFFGKGDIQDVEERLVGTRYDRTAIDEALRGMDISAYFGGVTREELLSLIY